MQKFLAQSGVFGPEQLAAMIAAYRAALTIASDEDGPFAMIPALDLRRRLSSIIISEARRGVLDADILKALALRSLNAASH